MDVPDKSVSRIEFRRGSMPVPWDEERSFPTIEVVIEGVNLVTLWRRVSGTHGNRALFAGKAILSLAMWGPENDTVDWPIDWCDGNEEEGGYVPVLTCSCTVLICGGVWMRVTFADDSVVWDEFHIVRHEERPPLGPFIFNRQQYEEARRAFSDEAP